MTLPANITKDLTNCLGDRRIAQLVLDQLIALGANGTATLTVDSGTSRIAIDTSAGQFQFTILDNQSNSWAVRDGVTFVRAISVSTVTGSESVGTGYIYYPSAGVAPAGSFAAIPANVGTWQPIAATSGTDTACSNGTAYVGSVFVPCNITVTGIQYLVGSVGGTNKVIASLHDSAGTLLANSDLAGATVGTAAQVQQVALTSTYAAVGPAWYFVALTFDGTTAKFRSVPAHCQAGSGVRGNGVAQTFGTAATFTAPTTFTADKVPVASLY